MDSGRNANNLEAYNTVLTAFLELRGRGVMVSAQDLETLKTWANDNLNPADIVECMIAISRDCEEKGKRFATSLKALDRTIRRALREKVDY